MAKFIKSVEIEIPNEAFDKDCKSVIKYSIDNKIYAMKEVRKLFNEYHEKYFKVILSSEIMYRFDFKTDEYKEDNQKYLKNYIKKTQITYKVTDKDGEEHIIKIKPYAEFEDYITNNGWEVDYRKNKPQLFKEIYNKNSCEIITKYINICPRIPLFLKDNQKPFEEYGEKQKEWVNDVFEMMKNNLCTNNERDFEYMKNWFIRKALMIRNETAVVLQTSTQGVGKTTFSELINHMFGENSNLVEISHHCTWLKEKFNTQLKGKVLMSIEELPRLNTTDWHDASEKLKDFITNGKATLESKGVDAKGGSPLFVDFVITSNGFHVPLEGNDRRYFVPTVYEGIIEDTKEKEIIDKVNAIVKNDDNLDINILNEYYRCLYAYCVENYNPKFNIRNIPVTDMLIKTNDKKMNLVYKYIKEFYLKSTNNIIKDEKTGEYYYKIFMKHLGEDLTKFTENIKKNPELLKKYNYSESKYNEFMRFNNKIDSCVVSKELKKIFNIEYFKTETKKENKNNVYLIISYNELLDTFKGKELVSNEEYEELKEKINEINNSNSNNNNNDNDNVEELIHHKDIYGIYNELKSDFDKIKKENEELKETLEKKTKETEIKNQEIEKINKELENIDNEFDKEKIKELIKPKIDNIFKKYSECIKCKYSKTNESEQEELFIKSLNTSKKIRDSFIEKKEKGELGFNPLLIEKQNKEEKEIKSIFEDLLKF